MAAFTIVGGVGYVIGPYWGAALQPGGVGTNIGQLFSSDVQNYLLLIGGVSLILVVLQAPDGLAPKTIKDLRTLARALWTPLGSDVVRRAASAARQLFAARRGRWRPGRGRRWVRGSQDTGAAGAGPGLDWQPTVPAGP